MAKGFDFFVHLLSGVHRQGTVHVHMCNAMKERHCVRSGERGWLAKGFDLLSIHCLVSIAKARWVRGGREWTGGWVRVWVWLGGPVCGDWLGGGG